MKSRVELKFSFAFETTDLNAIDIELIQVIYAKAAENSKKVLSLLSNYNIEVNQTAAISQLFEGWLDLRTKRHVGIYKPEDIIERDTYINNHPDKDYFERIIYNRKE